MTRQYIGARYVPKFFTDENGSSDWRDNIPYEALSIVMYLGNSYTSKKSVPVGVQITNTEYWALTGNYNGQVEEYRQDVEEYRQDVEEYRQEVEVLREGVESLKQTNLRIVFVGDSYADVDHAENSRWDYYCRTSLGLTDGDYYTTADSGAGFANESNKGYTFTTLLDLLKVNEPSTISHVVIVGGINDLNKAEAAIQRGVNSFCSKVRTMFPNAKIIYSFCQRNYGATATKMGLHRELINASIINNKGFADSDGFGRIWNRSYVGNDNVHPTVNGYYLIGRAMAGIITGCARNYDTMFNNTPNFTSNVGGTVRNAFYRGVYRNNFVTNIIDFTIVDCNFTIGNNETTSLLDLGNSFICNINEMGNFKYPAKIFTNDDWIDVLMWVEGTELKITNISGSDHTITRIYPISNGGGLHFELPADFV